MKQIIIFILLLVVTGCTQMMPLGMVWDKNTETDMHHYDLFTLVLSDSVSFYTLTEWPADTSVKTIHLDSTVHMPNLLSSIAHVHNSPVDSVVYEWSQRMSQQYLRGYILAADSAGNTSTIATSINIVFIGDRDAPEIPTQYLIFESE